MKIIKAEYPYSNYIIYGPYFHKKENRYYVYLIDKVTKKRSSTSYARYLKAIQLKRILGEKEQVDHRDGNCKNDTIENLQLLTHRDNIKKYLKQHDIRKTIIQLCCPNCEKLFLREKRNTFLSKHGTFTACSRHCAGIIRRHLQLGIKYSFANNIINYDYTYPEIIKT